MELYAKIEDNEYLKHKNINAKVAAVIRIASYQTGYYKSIKQILEATKATQKKMNKYYNKIKEIIPEAKVHTQASKIAEITCNRLSLPMEMLMAAKAVSHNITKL